MGKSVTIYVLPKEIIQSVMGFLDRKSLYQCRQVCASFYRIAMPIYLKEIYLSGNHRLFLELIYKRYFYGRALGEYVKKLVIKTSNMFYLPLNKDEFQKLMSHLPYLEYLQFDEDDYDPMATCNYIRFLDTLPNTVLSSLKHITLPPNPDFSNDIYDVYANICYRLRKQLVTSFFYSLPLDTLYGHPNIKSFLSEFESLQNLTLYLIDTDKETIHIPEVLYCCPQLKSLTLSLSSSWIIDDDSPEIAYKSLIYPVLESLQLNIDSIGLQQLYYIQHHLPNVKRLMLEQYDNTWGEVYCNMGFIYRKELAKYWMSLDYVSLTNFVYDEHFIYTGFSFFLKELHEKGYAFDFIVKTHLGYEFEGIKIDNKSKKVELCIQFNDMDKGLSENSAWTSLARVIPSRTINIELDYQDSGVKINAELLSALIIDTSTLRKINIISLYKKFYLGTPVSVDWLYKIRVDDPPLPVKKTKEPMTMLFLSVVDLSTDLFQAISNISNKVENIIIWKCDLNEDIIDLRAFENLSRLELDLSSFSNYNTRRYHIKFISDQKENIFCCCPLVGAESIEHYDFKEEISLSIKVLYTQLNQLTMKFESNIRYSSQDGTAFSKF